MHWKHDDVTLDITAFAQGTPRDSQLVVRYRLANPGGKARDYTLALAVQPFQVNPPSQFLNIIGGVSPLRALSVTPDRVAVDGTPRTTRLAALAVAVLGGVAFLMVARSIARG